MHFYLPRMLSPFLSSTVFSFSFSTGWFCRAGVNELIGCKSLSYILELPTLINNSYNNNDFSSLVALAPIYCEDFFMFSNISHISRDRCSSNNLSPRDARALLLI